MSLHANLAPVRRAGSCSVGGCSSRAGRCARRPRPRRSERTRRWLRAAARVTAAARPQLAPQHPGRSCRSAVERSALRGCGDAAQIAEILGIALSTVSLWLKRIGLGKRSRLEPPEPPNRYERRHPGELVHVDIKTLGRISAGRRPPRARPPGSQHSPAVTRRRAHRLRIRPRDGRRPLAPRLCRGPRDLTARCAVAFLRRAVAWLPSSVSASRRDDRQRCLPTSPTLTAAASSNSASHLRIARRRNQRQSRALHPDPPQRMGLRTHLRAAPTRTRRSHPPSHYTQHHTPPPPPPARPRLTA